MKLRGEGGSIGYDARRRLPTVDPSLRPCPSCGRHSKTDEPRCPFCDAELPLSHRLPVVDLREVRPAPKYGAPPLVRLGIYATFLGLLGGLIAIAYFLLGRR